MRCAVRLRSHLTLTRVAMAQLLDERESQRLNFGETISVPVMGPLDLYRVRWTVPSFTDAFVMLFTLIVHRTPSRAPWQCS